MQTQHTIPTMAGVLEFGDPAGVITVEREPGSTVLTLKVDDDKTGTMHVFLDRAQVTELVMALSASAIEL